MSASPLEARLTLTSAGSPAPAANADAEALTPDMAGPGLIWRVLPFDGRALERSLEEYLRHLPDLGLNLADWAQEMNLQTSLFALAASAAVFEIGRRQLKRKSWEQSHLVAELEYPR